MGAVQTRVNGYLDLFSIIRMFPPPHGEGDLPLGFLGVVLPLYPGNVPFFVPSHPYGFKPLFSALSRMILNLQHF